MNGGPAPDFQESSPIPPLAAAADQPKPIIEQASSIAVSPWYPTTLWSGERSARSGRQSFVSFKTATRARPEHQVAADLRVVKTLHVGAHQ